MSTLLTLWGEKEAASGCLGRQLMRYGALSREDVHNCFYMALPKPATTLSNVASTLLSIFMDR